MFSVSLAIGLKIAAAVAVGNVGRGGGSVLLVSLDGLRADFANLFSPGALPAFSSLLRHGSSAKYVQPVFPSEGFPSWTTISTGLYPEDHGITGDYMLDIGGHIAFDRVDSGGGGWDTTADRRWWRGHVPLWTRAMVSGINCSLQLWSRCDVPFEMAGRDWLPPKCSPYAHQDSHHLQILTTALGWMVEDLADGSVRLAMAHYGGVAAAAQRYGPRSYQVAEEIFMVDRALGTLRRHLQRRALQVDLLVVSPHGIADTTNMTWRLDLADFVDFRNLHFVVGRGAHADIKVKQHIDPAKVYPDLLNWGAMKVYNVSSMPKRMRVSKGEWMLDFTLVSSGEHLLAHDPLHRTSFIPIETDDERDGKQPKGVYGFDDTSEGYENEGESPEMRGFFAAEGPSFRQNYQGQWIKLTDIYQILCYILGLDPGVHSGSWHRVRSFLAPSKRTRRKKFPSGPRRPQWMEQIRTFNGPEEDFGRRRRRLERSTEL